jgi:hypothetical protein
MSILLQDVRFELRGMAHRPGFTAVILATRIGHRRERGDLQRRRRSAASTARVRARPKIVDFTHTDISVSSRSSGTTNAHPAGKARRLSSRVDATLRRRRSCRAGGTRLRFFEILGVKPVIGRTFARDEFSHLAKARIVIISNALWRQQFAEDPRIVGRTMQVNGNPATIIGVMPAGVVLPDGGDMFWVPWRMNPDSLWTRNNHYLRLVGELRPGATVAQAETQARTLNTQ